MDNPLIKNWSSPVAGTLWAKVQMVAMLVAGGVLAVVLYAYMRPPAYAPVVTRTPVMAELPMQPPPVPPRAFRSDAPPPETRQPPAAPKAPGGAGTAVADPLRDEQRKRAYTSLFASNLVSESATTRGAGPTSLDATADAAVRALQRVNPPAAPPAHVEGHLTDSVDPVVRQTPPIDARGPMHPVLESTILDTVLQQQLDGGSASPVVVRVTNPLYSFNGQYILIPAGTKVLGESKPVQQQNESRLAVSFHRLIFPDGRTQLLDQDLGLDQTGSTGIHDKTDRHVWAMFGAATAVGLIQGLSQAIGTVGYSGGRNNSTVVVSGATTGTSQAANQVMQQFTNRMPTITIRPGVRVKVYIQHDFELPVYRGGE